MDGDFLLYRIEQFDTPSIVIVNDMNMRARDIRKLYDAPVGSHLGRKKTSAAVSREFVWAHMYKWVRN